MKRVYLAGPDVFFKDAIEHAEQLKHICAEHLLEGVFPLDAVIEFDRAMPGDVRAMRIFTANISLIESCHGVLANMTPFRGPSTDVGTAWEMGYAFARRIPVVGYSTDQRAYEMRVTPDGYNVEDFELVDNLMLACSVSATCRDIESAIKLLARAVVNTELPK